MINSGGRVGCSALVILLVSLGAAVEVYDANPDAPEEDMAYQEDNIIDTGPFSRQGLEPRQPAAGDVVLYRLVQALAHDQLNSQFRPNWPDSQDMVAPQFPPGMKPVFKRFPTPFRAQPVRPQQKWKIKKGKALGSQMVCYFKLCAFRSPH